MNHNQNSSKKRHMYIGSPSQLNEKISFRVAQEFCKAYQRHFNVSASWCEKKVEIENVDAIVIVDGEEIALEMLSYRQRDEFHERESDDTQLIEHIREVLYKSEVPPVSLQIRWRVEERKKLKKGYSVKRTMIPVRDDKELFGEEIVGFCERVVNTPEMEGKHIYFRDLPEHAKPCGQTGTAIISTSDFPVLSKYCESIRLKLNPYPFIRTSADTRSLAFNRIPLEEDIRGKLTKVPRYREGINGKQLWLVIHSDGSPLSTSLPNQRQEEALQLIRELFEQAEDTFDRVWWIDKTAFVDAASLWEC